MIRRLRHPGVVGAAELASWRTAAAGRLRELLALPRDRTHDGAVRRSDGWLSGDEVALVEPPEPRLVTLDTEDGEIPCWLLRPPADRALAAGVVAVAGHGPGVDALVEPAPHADDFHGGLARKLAAAGFTVLCPEMISFGRRRTPVPDTAPPSESSCQVDAMRGLLTGHPVLGRRVADTLAAVRALRRTEGVPPGRVAVVGGSGGGAVALLAAALDQQIPAAVVGTFVSSFTESLCAVPHCVCNAVPDLLTWFEMADLAALVAPRRLIIEAGRRDPIFPIAATERAYAELLDVWRAHDAEPPDLVITETGHRFLADDSINRLAGHFRAHS